MTGDAKPRWAVREPEPIQERRIAAAPDRAPEPPRPLPEVTGWWHQSRVGPRKAPAIRTEVQS